MLGQEFLTKLDDESVKKFVEATTNWMTYIPPKDYSEILTCYTKDYELWWKEARPLVNEW